MPPEKVTEPLPVMDPPPAVFPEIWLKISCGPEKRASAASWSMTMPVTWLSSRAFWVLSDPRITGLASRPPMSAPTASGPDMSMTSLPVRRHKRIGGPGIAQLREQRRIHQLGDQRAIAERREARLGAPDDRTVARGHCPKRRLVAVDDRGNADVDRLRGEHEAGAAEAADLEVEPSATVRLPRIVDASGRRAGEVEIGPEDVEHLERHSGELRMNFGRRAAAARKLWPCRRRS